ncbi:MAG: DUF2336 domain-containing protein [Burkholderiales bacterium]|nr:DUF2336 domain-containing protein [Burkholderiales bacterium]
MQAFSSLVRDVEDAIASGEDARRADTLRRLSGLFVELSPQLNEDHVGVFDEVIVRLAHEIEFRARVELAERLADVSNAPRRTVRDLAFDQSIEIAGPILERSTRLDERDLVAIAQERGQDHLLALSVRQNLTEAVTDVLVTRGDQRVVQTVAGNKTAAFSNTGFDTLVQRAMADPRLQGILETRGDLTNERMEMLVTAAKERAQRDLLARSDEDTEMLREALQASAENLLAEGSTIVLMEDLLAAAPRAEALEKSGELNEEAVARLLRENKVADALVAIGRLAKMEPELMGQAYNAPHFDPLLFVVKGVRFGWPTFKLLLGAKVGKNPPQALLKTAFASFEALSAPTAQRVMRFVVAKQKMVKA